LSGGGGVGGGIGGGVDPVMSSMNVAGQAQQQQQHHHQSAAAAAAVNQQPYPVLPPGYSYYYPNTGIVPMGSYYTQMIPMGGMVGSTSYYHS